MKTQSIFANALLIAAAAAAPAGKNSRANRLARRGAPPSRGPSKPIITANYTVDSSLASSGTRFELESENWTGAILTSPPSGEYFSSAVGTFTVPTPKEPSGGSSSTEYSGAAWVGIDGDTCTTAIIQAGVDWSVEDGNEYVYSAWYEWYPAYSETFEGFKISAGDVITISINATSDTAGSVTVTDVTTGKSQSHTWTNQASVGELCRQNAEWIVEDYESDSSLVPFANFGTVTFSNASAGLTGGGSEGFTDASTIVLENSSDQIITSVTIESSSEVTIKYT